MSTTSIESSFYIKLWIYCKKANQKNIYLHCLVIIISVILEVRLIQRFLEHRPDGDYIQNLHNESAIVECKSKMQ